MLIQQGLLEQDMEHGSLRLTPAGQDVLAGARVTVAAERPRPAAPAAATPYDEALFERLRGSAPPDRGRERRPAIRDLLRSLPGRDGHLVSPV